MKEMFITAIYDSPLVAVINYCHSYFSDLLCVEGGSLQVIAEPGQTGRRALEVEVQGLAKEQLQGFFVSPLDPQWLAIWRLFGF